MPRAIWTGAIAFGLVNIPVRIYSAVHEHKVNFHLRHEKDGGAIGYAKICKAENEPVPNDEIVKVYEYEKGEYVEITDEDFAAVKVEGTRTIDLEDFVPYETIDPSFFSHTYLVGPQEGAERPYALLVEAMSESELAGIGKFVMRSRQYLGCLRIRGGVLTLEQMYFHDEVDKPESVVPSKLPDVPKRELEMARALIDNFSTEWKPAKYKDTYHEAMCRMIKEKIAGHDVHETAEEPEPEATPDLMAALRASIAAAQKGGGRKTATKRSNGNGNGRAKLERLSKAELQERAKKAGVEGRSKMSKDELVAALS